MPVRLILILTALAVGLLAAWNNPFRALLFYLWFAYFRPDDWVGWMPVIRNMRLSLVIGVFVLAGALLTAKKIRAGLVPVLLLLFLALSLISTQLSVNPDWSALAFRKFVPAIIIGYVMTLLVVDERRLRDVFVVIAVSLGLELSKQGWANVILHPGSRMFPSHVALGDNNGVAIGMYMLVPILLVAANTAKYRFEGSLYRFLTIGVLYTGFATYSRGGFLSAITLGLHYLLRSKNKIPAAVAVVVVSLVIGPLFPQWFWDRMWTIETATTAVADSTRELDAEQMDASMRSRLHFWNVAIDMAEDHPITGVGFNAFNVAYNRYDFLNGTYGRGRSVHSMWFGVLAELGIPGFLIFISLLAGSLWNCRGVRRLAKQLPEAKNLALYSNAIEAGIFVAMVGGSFIIFQYTEMLWHLFALSFVVRQLARKYETASLPIPAPAFALSGPRAALGGMSPVRPDPVSPWAVVR